MDFSDQQIRRYARHILLNEIGGAGQAKLLASRVLVVGAGGLGSPLLLYLAAAGVGTLGVIDDDVVDLTNLQRQIAHTTDRIGMPKVESARAAVAAINPEVEVIAHQERLTAANALDLVSAYDIVADGSDNFPTRFLVNDACFFAGKPLVSAAILRFDGQLATFKAYERGGRRQPGPCYRCLYGAPPPPGRIPSCAEAGVLGAFCGALGGLQATEVIKELLGIGVSLSGWLLVCRCALRRTWRRIRVRRDPGCPLCGDQPSIRDLSRSCRLNTLPASGPGEALGPGAIRDLTSVCITRWCSPAALPRSVSPRRCFSPTRRCGRCARAEAGALGWRSLSAAAGSTAAPSMKTSARAAWLASRSCCPPASNSACASSPARWGFEQCGWNHPRCAPTCRSRWRAWSPFSATPRPAARCWYCSCDCSRMQRARRIHRDPPQGRMRERETILMAFAARSRKGRST